MNYVQTQALISIQVCVYFIGFMLYGFQVAFLHSGDQI